MSAIPRVSSAIPGEPAHFGSVLAHQPAIAASFFALYGRFWGSDVLPTPNAAQALSDCRNWPLAGRVDGQGSPDISDVCYRIFWPRALIRAP